MKSGIRVFLLLLAAALSTPAHSSPPAGTLELVSTRRLMVGDRSLFGYDLNEIASIYRDGGLPSGMQHTFEVVVSGKGDNRTYRGQTVAYFEYRDRDDVTALTKGAGYAGHFSVALHQGRNNVPYDDVVGVAVGNTGGNPHAKATAAIYISENRLFARTGKSEWYSLLTMDALSDVGIQIKHRPASGKVARLPNDSFAVFANAAGNADVKAIGLDKNNRVVIGDRAAAGIDMLAPVRSMTRPVTPVISVVRYRVSEADHKLTFSAPSVVALPRADSCPGREIWIRSTGSAVSSSSPNVVPLAGGGAASLILSGRGKWALLYSDGAVWQTQAAN